MSEPWGYIEENDYQSKIGDGVLNGDEFFADVKYNRNDNKIHFANKFGKEVGTLNVSDFVNSDSVIEDAKYENGKLIIKFTNGDVITIDMEELVDENEFKNGLQVNDGIVSVLVDEGTEKNASGTPYLAVSENGLKVEGINAAIQVETSRATSAEQSLTNKINTEKFARESSDTRITNLISSLDEKKLDKRTYDDAELALSEALNTLYNDLGGDISALTQDLHDLDERKFDISAYTPTDLSDYYTKSETSGASAISAAISEMASKSEDLGNIKLKALTQAEYDALYIGGTTDANTLYIITD